VLTDTGLAVLTQQIARYTELEPEHIVMDGVPHRKVVDESGLPITTPYGSIKVDRALYRKVGQRGVKGVQSVGALERHLGLINKQTPRMARMTARFEAEVPSRLIKELLEETGVRSPNRTALDRFVRTVGLTFANALPDVLAAVRCDTAAPSGIARVSVHIDRVRVQMHEAKPGKPFSEATRKRRKRVDYKRKPPEGFEINGRMAYVATTVLYDDRGDVVSTFRYAAPHDSDPAALVAEQVADVRWLRQSNPDLEVDMCHDGALDLWKVSREGFSKIEDLVICMVVDWRHFINRTKPVLTPLFDEAEVEQWESDLQRKAGSVGRLLSALWERLALSPDQDALYEEVRRFEGYLTEREGLFDYAGQLAAGRVLGSGAVEATCKLVVRQRMRRNGQRWKQSGAQGCMALRAIAHSRPLPHRRQPGLDRWEQAWGKFAQQFRSTITQYQAPG